MNKRAIGILILLAVVAFYAFGTGFAFFYRLLYVLVLVLGLGLVWAWLGLRGLAVEMTRADQRGQVGGVLEGRVRLENRFWLPKSWLQVSEVTDLPDNSDGRGIAVMGGQSRAWRIQTRLTRRGVYTTGQVEVVSQDPFGLFRMRRRFYQPQSYVVYPATVPLPDLDPRFANLPADSRVSRRADHITPDSSTVREYTYGDSLRRIHWPYTARMNTLMVKEFDMGVSAESWLVLDLQRSVQAGQSPDTTDELAISLAASIASRLTELEIPVGLAASGEQTYIIRPDSGPGHLGRIMDDLAAMRAGGYTSLERFLYDLRPGFNRFNTVMVITPSYRMEWVTALAGLRRQGVNVAVALIDAASFGNSTTTRFALDALFAQDIPAYLIRRGGSLNEALRAPLNREAYQPAAPEPARTPAGGSVA